jgi:predicted ATPase
MDERWFEAEVHRVAGEIALKLPERDAAKAKAHLEGALIGCAQATSEVLELRAAMRMARLWRNQGKRQQAHDLFAQSMAGSPRAVSSGGYSN